mmetsp:Transcript_945/g.1405  ORF Transcript_945/g.1405 Transcript_945/m.1405 type:complete len:312 (-) Transcript_945:344-1279(-)
MIVGIVLAVAFNAGLLGLMALLSSLNPDKLPVCTYGNVNDTIPTLGTATADVAWGATDHKILARIFYGDDDKNGQWSDWRNINNAGCDDRERGQIDFYDDFSNIYDRWLAVALYNCGTDGFALDAIFYWNGTNFKENYIDNFCGNVAGPMVGCYGGAYDPAETGSYCFQADQTAKYYDHVWIDQNNAACPGVLIATGKTLKGNSSEPVGKLYGKADPGTPDCDLYTTTNSRTHPNFVSDPQPVNEPDDVYRKPVETVTITSTAMNVLIAAIAILVCLNVVMMAKMWCTNKRGRGSLKVVKYAKVDMDESSA